MTDEKPKPKITHMGVGEDSSAPALCETCTSKYRRPIEKRSGVPNSG